MKFQPIQFKRPGQEDFYKTVRARVNAYFEQNKISTKGDIRMFVKTAVLLLMLAVPFVFVLIGVQPYWLYLAMWALMGIAVAGIGLSIMHDANHDSYSNNPRLNRMMGTIMNVVGGYDLNWRIQHNILHHSFTNVDGHDEDILAQPMLRFSPHQPLRKRHRFQFLYSWFLYGMMTMFWVTYKDFAQLIRYDKMNLLASQKTTLKKAMWRLAIHKVAYYIVALVLPLVLAPYAWWQVLIGFVVMHALTGLILSLIFQPAHVIPETEFTGADHGHKMEHGWAEHQLMTTANFAPKNKVLTWFIGGLNYQIEHHLFPNICHIHYPAIAQIVRQTAEEYNLPYHVEKTFAGALWSHAKMLKRLGERPKFAA